MSFCAECGAPNSLDDAYCAGCGRPLSVGGSRPTIARTEIPIVATATSGSRTRMRVRKIPKSGIVLGIVVVVVVVGFGYVRWNGSADTNEGAPSPTSSISPITTTSSTSPITTTISQVTFMPAQAGGTGRDGGFGVSVTSDGGAIVTGEFGGTATFGSTKMTSNGELDVFVGKISAAGEWEWATQAGGTGLIDGGGVSVTSDGGAIVSGVFAGTATVGSATLTSNGRKNDVFVGKISAAGVWEWVIQAGGTGWDVGFDVSVTSDDGAIVAGYFSGTARFGSTILTSNGAKDVFVGKISAAGVWGS